MSAAIYNDFIIEQKDTVAELWTYCASDGTTPINLSGFTSAALEIRDSEDTLIFAFRSSPSASEGTITLGGALGTINITASGTLTASLTPGTYYYDLYLYSATENDRVMAGKIQVVKRVTQ